MTAQRLIIEMGMGLDLHGQDYTKAACRAVRDAMAHSALPILSAPDLPDSEVDIHVTVGVAVPEAVDVAQVAAELPRGQVQVKIVEGGLDVATSADGPPHVAAQAAVEVFLPSQAFRVAKGAGV